MIRHMSCQSHRISELSKIVLCVGIDHLPSLYSRMRRRFVIYVAKEFSTLTNITINSIYSLYLEPSLDNLKSNA